MTDEALHLLLIEDNPGDAELVAILLTEEDGFDCQITNVASLKEAVKELNASKVDVILADLSLPDSFGLETVNELTRQAPLSPIIVLSGNSDQAIALDAVKHGAQDYLMKGESDGATLARAIRYAIERKQTELKLEELAHYDALTGLVNRALFNRRLEHTIHNAERQDTNFALIFIDLDKFKQINDTLGHESGDELLRQVAQRMKSVCRVSDTVARMGGDEFTILLESTPTIEGCVPFAEKILKVMDEPFDLYGEIVTNSPSIGIALYPHGGKDAESLMKNADTAMYQAKNAGKKTYRIFTDGMSDNIQDRINMERALRKALDRNEFELLYHPVVDVNSGYFVATEALIRWNNPVKGGVLPAEFIPLAEQTGLIAALGEWVFCEVIRQMEAWQEAGMELLPTSINLSSFEFFGQDFVDKISAYIERSAVPANVIDLGLSERCFQGDNSQVESVLVALKNVGVKVTIDDFGAGFSPLFLLKQWPIDTIKIHSLLLKTDHFNQKDAAIMDSIIQLAKNLALSVVVKCVEQEDQRDFFKQHGCHLMQGYIFNKPMNPAAYVEQLKKQQARKHLRVVKPRPA